MKRGLGLIFLLILWLLGSGITVRSEEVILQYFGTGWSEIARRIPELAEAGYTALWLPPPFKAGAGTFSVGFDTYDRFDLGSKYQMGTVPTKYGTETELLHLMRVAHRFGFRVYFDNVMAHNGGPMIEGPPGTLNPHGFVPEDFHLIRTGEETYQTPEWPNWDDEWQVLNRNPFGQDIAQEDPNDSFGWSEGDTYDKWSGVRHPDNPEYYLDTDLPITYNNGSVDFTMYHYANKEPFEDIGYTNSSSTYVTNAKWNARFDWEDTNGNGQHDAGEPSEPFTDTGIDPGRPDRRNTTWGYGDGVYNMGNPHAEDVNSMLYRAVRWFTDRFKPDGYRLDAVKHVPAYFFGKMDEPKDDSDWGYGGQIQIQFNLSRGYSDWNNHRDTVFNNVQARDDALLYGEHLGNPPDKMLYVAAGMRIANDDFLNAVKGSIGADLQGMDNSYYGIISPGNSMLYVMSHDNNYLWGGDRQQANAMLLTREGLPIVYTDGYNQSGEPDWFPKPAEIPFLNQFGNEWMLNLLDINRHFGWGYQGSRYSAWDYSSYTRYDEDIDNNGQGVYMVFGMSKNYIEGWPLLAGGAVFPDGARLFNYSMFNKGHQVKVEEGNIVNMDGTAIYMAPNEYVAYSWRIPEMPLVWGNELTAEKRPIMITENGQPVGSVTVPRRDGRDGDPAFNPYGLSDPDTTDYTYSIDLPRVTSSTNLSFIARADGSAENILMKLDGGIDLNSQMAFTSEDYGTRDRPPAITKDRLLGFEQMQYVQRVCEKFAARDTGANNIIGSLGAETYMATIGSAGFTYVAGSGENTSAGTAEWVYHNPEDVHSDGSTLQFHPAPENATGQGIFLAVKVGYTGQTDRTWVYYTTDGSNPEGSGGIGKGTTHVAPMTQYAVTNGAGWWSSTLPAQGNGTELRYKISSTSSDSPSRFPWSDEDIAIVPRMETMFEITNFNAATIPYYPHNDWGTMATGLDEGFHVLRTKTLLGRGEGDAAIFRENTQTFYYDAQPPEASFVFPAADGSILDESSYTVVLHSDMTVEEVWYNIDDSDPTNDDGETGLANGNNAWVKAEQGLLPAPNPGSAPEKQWEFDYVSIPSNGAATIQVVLREVSSSTNLALSAQAGHFARLERTVSTGSDGTRLYITQPSSDGQTLGIGSNLVVRFSKSIADGLNDADLLSCFGLNINDIAETPVSQSITRDVSTSEHQYTCALPNFYNGNPGDSHTLQITFTRDGYPSMQAQRTAYAQVNDDSNNDGIPDTYEITWGLPAQTLTPEGDYDSDGITDFLEYLANTDPTDPESFFKITEGIPLDANTLSLRFPAGDNRNFYIWYTESIESPEWTRLSGTPMTGSGQISEYNITTTGQTQRYYKVQAALPQN
jgi:glycosidase